MHRHRKMSLFLVSCLLGLLTTLTAHAQQYKLTVIPTPTGDFGSAQDINDNGQVVGSMGGQAFVWDPINGVKSLGALGNSGSVGLGINASGQVVGSSHISQPYFERAFHWDALHGIQSLGTLPGDIESRAMGINAKGQIVGFSTTPDPQRQQAVLWSPDGAIHPLGTLGGMESDATAINDKGQVVGFSQTSTGGSAFLWDETHGMQALNGLEDTVSVGNGINAKGQVVGYYTLNSGLAHAFVWDAMNGLNDLGTLPDDILSRAEDINDKGEVVGFSYSDTPFPHERAFVYRNKKMENLNDLFVSDEPGWILSDVHGINNLGQIVGDGYNYLTFQLNPILLSPILPNTVPEPGALALWVGMGLPFLTFLARRRKQ